MKEAFFKHGEKEALRSCMKGINLCCTASRGELQDFSRNKLKELEDELFAKLKHAMRELEVYSVIVCMCIVAYWSFILYCNSLLFG